MSPVTAVEIGALIVVAIIWRYTMTEGLTALAAVITVPLLALVGHLLLKG